MKTHLPDLALLSALVALAAGCGRGGTEAAPSYRAPNLNGAYSDPTGVLRPVSRTLAVIACGGQAEGTLPASGELAGYEFEAFAGTVPMIELRSEGAGARPALALYGPRTEQGRWGDPLASQAADAPGTLRLEGPAAAAAGTYFILVQGRAAQAGGSYVLQLGCQGNVGAPSCPDLTPCDRICALGFTQDASGCRSSECSCVEQAQCDAADPCPAGLDCGPDGRCHDRPDPCASCPGTYQPVCGSDGQTYGNACRASCAGTQVAHPGACVAPPPCGAGQRCPDGLICQDGSCVETACPCAQQQQPDQPVCSRSGRTWRNLCELSCRTGEELAYYGECRPRGCRDDSQCPPESPSCQPVDDAQNLGRCRQDPRGPDCIRECRAPLPLACGGAAAACPDGQFCYALAASGQPPAGPGAQDGQDAGAPQGLDGSGACLLVCLPGQAAGCGVGLTCAQVQLDGLPQGSGLCLPGCSAQAPACLPGFSCQPDAGGQSVCQACSCPEEPGGQEVCSSDNHTFHSACEARCAGVRSFRDGACEDAPTCVCPPLPEPVCATDGVIYNNFCEARCAGEGDAPAESCYGPGVQQGCNADADCQVTGCSATVCAAAATGSCPRYSAEAMCQVQFGLCGCNHGSCQFEQTPRSQGCQADLHGGGHANAQARQHP